MPKKKVLQNKEGGKKLDLVATDFKLAGGKSVCF